MNVSRSAFALAALMLGCGESDLVTLTDDGAAGQTGPAGSDGATGNDGIDGRSPLLRFDPEPSGAHCDNGGNAVHTGIDLDGDQQLDEDEVTTTQYLCDAGLVGGSATIEGSYTIRNSLDIALLEGVSSITGDLLVQAPGLTALSLPALTELGGSLTIQSNADLLTVSLPNLSSVETVNILGNSRLLNVAADLSGDPEINVTDNPELLGLGTLGDLSASSSVQIRRNAKLTTLAGFDGIQSLDRLILVDNPLLSDMSALAELSIISGDLTIGSDGPIDWASFGHVNAVTGTLLVNHISTLVHLDAFSALTTAGAVTVLDNPGLVSVSFPALTAVAGSLTIQDNPLLATVNGLNALSSVGEHILIFQLAGTFSFSLPLVQPGDVTGGIVVSNNQALTAIPDFAQLESVGSAIIVENNPLLVGPGLVALQNVGDVLQFQRNPQLPALDLPAVLSVGGLDIFDNAALSSLHFDSLASIHQAVRVEANPSLLQMGPAFAALTSAGGVNVSENSALSDVSFPALTTSGGLYIVSNSLLTDVSFPALASVSAGIMIGDNPFLARLHGFDALSSVAFHLSISENGSPGGGGFFADPATGDVKGNIEIQANAELTAIPDFPSLSSVGVNLVVRFNPKLVSLGLVAIDSVPNALLIEDNPSLAQCLVDAVAAQMSQPPTTFATNGNDDAGVCFEAMPDVELARRAAKIERAMARRNMTQAELARSMRTNRTVIHRLLDPRDTSVTLATLSKASKALGVMLLKVA